MYIDVLSELTLVAYAKDTASNKIPCIQLEIYVIVYLQGETKGEFQAIRSRHAIIKWWPGSLFESHRLNMQVQRLYKARPYTEWWPFVLRWLKVRCITSRSSHCVTSHSCSIGALSREIDASVLIGGDVSCHVGHDGSRDLPRTQLHIGKLKIHQSGYQLTNLIWA